MTGALGSVVGAENAAITVYNTFDKQIFEHSAWACVIQTFLSAAKTSNNGGVATVVLKSMENGRFAVGEDEEFVFTFFDHGFTPNWEKAVNAELLRPDGVFDRLKIHYPKEALQKVKQNDHMEELLEKKIIAVPTTAIPIAIELLHAYSLHPPFGFTTCSEPRPINCICRLPDYLSLAADFPGLPVGADIKPICAYLLTHLVTWRMLMWKDHAQASLSPDDVRRFEREKKPGFRDCTKAG